MNDIVPFNKNLPAERAIGGQVARHMDSMRNIAELAKAAMDEISETTGYSVYKTATTLAGAEVIKRAIGELPPNQQAAFQAQLLQYLQFMLKLSLNANENIARTAQQGDKDTRSNMEKLADWLGGI